MVGCVSASVTDGYEIVQTFQSGETVTIQALPNVTFTVDEILGN
ncbi:hypothetical protein [Okeania sp. SIO1I7]|nr:hypothetical protein [Okeania sp. SIO1I7]